MSDEGRERYKKGKEKVKYHADIENQNRKDEIVDITCSCSAFFNFFSG